MAEEQWNVGDLYWYVEVDGVPSGTPFRDITDTLQHVAKITYEIRSVEIRRCQATRVRANGAIETGCTT